MFGGYEPESQTNISITSFDLFDTASSGSKTS
jgi:hypothetical protein